MRESNSFMIADQPDVDRLPGVDIQHMFKNCPGLLCTLTVHGTILWANNSWSDVVGHSPGALIGRSLLDFVPPQQRDVVHSGLHAMAAGMQDVSFEVPIRCEDASYVSLRWKCRRRPEYSSIYAVVDEVTRERQARELIEGKLALTTLCNEIWNAVVQCRDSQDVLSRWANSLSRHTDYAVVGIWLRSGGSSPLTLQVVGGAAESDVESLLQFALHDVETALLESKSIIIADLIADLRWHEQRPLLECRRVTAMAVHPITADGDAVGAVGVFFRGDVSNQTLHRVAMGVDEMSVAFSQLCAHSRLRQASATLGTLMRCAPLGLIELDLQGNVVTWSIAAERIFGWSQVEIKGRPLPVVAGIVSPGFPDWFGSALRGQATMHVDAQGRRRDGTIVDIGVSLAPHYGGGATIQGIIAIIADVSYRKRSEQQLALQQSVTSIVADSHELNDAVVKILETTCNSLGWERGEFWKINLTPGTARLTTRWRSAEGAILSPVGTAGVDLPLSDGSCLPVHVYRKREPVWLPGVASSQHSESAATPGGPACGDLGAVGFPVLIADGIVVGVLLFFSQQIPEPDRQLQQTLTAVAGQITQFIQRQQTESTLETAEANLRQSQKMEAIGLLAGGVAHDFNNLLTVIIAHSEIAQELLPDHDQVREMLGEIELAGKQAAALTRQLLAFSRKQIVDPIIINLNDRVVEMERMLCRLIGKDIELQTGLAPDLYQVRADPAQIEQVLLNLIVNAKDAMPQGGRLSITTSNVELDGTDWRESVDSVAGPFAMLQVTDTGCGMNEETKLRIFEPFFTTKEMGKGTGMGLATVYAIVQQCGGGLKVESQLNQGTTFNVFFPRVRDVLQPRQVESAPEPIPRGTETILVVDDEERVRSVVCAILQVQGYTVMQAAGSAEAWELCRRRRNRPDLILTDVIMPGMNGQELADRIADGHSEIKLLLMSGYAGDEIRVRGLQRAGLPFLHKPFTSEALARKIREVLDD